jgi:2-isopropylmalate synthase
MDSNIIKIFDTTLRDGEQSPGASMNTEEKIKIAKQLEKLGVDIIESGFAAASLGDFDAIVQISKVIEKTTVCSLARALDGDIKKAGESISLAKYGRLHTFIATSKIHMEHKLKMSSKEVLDKAVNAVQYAKTFVDDVEFSCEDAGRSDISFLKEVSDAVINAGATTINLPDTVGYRLPSEVESMVRELVAFVGDRAIISVHNHNDLGLAVANSLSSVMAGARQVECTINGLGERAGNASLEEIVMAIKTRQDIFCGIDTNINTKEIYGSSKLVATITGIVPQPNKAIVGKNAFTHESGIHQDGVLKNKSTYEIMRAEDIGLNVNAIVLGKHSGRHAFSQKIKSLGFELDGEQLDKVFIKFKAIADKKKDIYDDDIRMIVNEETNDTKKIYELVKLQVSDCSKGVPSSVVTISKDDSEITEAGIGEGVIDAVFKTIDRAVKITGKLKDYKVDAVSEGKKALAYVTVKVQFDENQRPFIGHGLNIDTMVASAKAYISALNSYCSMKH